MKGIYLTQEGKQEIEDEIKNLEDMAYASGVNTEHYFKCFSKIELLQEILYFATVLPAEDSWDDVHEEDIEKLAKKYVDDNYPHYTNLKEKAAAIEDVIWGYKAALKSVKNLVKSKNNGQ